MEILTVKNNIMNYSNLKKIRFYFFNVLYKYFFLSAFVLSLLAVVINVFERDISGFIEYALIFVFVCMLPFIQSKAMLKRLMKLQIEKYGTDEVFFDLIFDEDEIISVEQSSQSKSNIKYKDIKKVIEIKEIVLFISKAGFTTFFEKNKVELNDIEKLKQFFDKQNIPWKKSIFNII